ncbi:MAG: NIF family HAD-type phosphatase [Myxococcota bacterium]
MSISTLALDLEGTLISNAMSQFPRPGLWDFLTFCFTRYDVLLFTAVREARARRVVERLVTEGDAPAPFATIPYVPWEGEYKDVRFLLRLRPSLDIAQVRLVDDLEMYVHPEQKHLWIPIVGWHAPYPAEDTALASLMTDLQA